MKGLPLVSVIICFLNAERFIEEAIESVVAQTCGDWELVLVDDGSDDSSTKIARRYVTRFPYKIRYFEHLGHTNRGASAARNIALQHALGEYIAILDADDAWFPDALERRLQLMRSHPEVGMVYGPAMLWRSWAGESDGLQWDCLENLSLAAGTVFTPPAYCSYLLGYDAAIPSPCTVLIRRDVLRAVGGFENSFRTLFDDQVLYIKLSLGTSVLVSDICDSKYRQHAESICAVADRDGRTDAARLVYLDWVGRYLYERGVEDKQVWAALHSIRNRFQWPRLFRFSQTARRIIGRVVSL